MKGGYVRYDDIHLRIVSQKEKATNREGTKDCIDRELVLYLSIFKSKSTFTWIEVDVGGLVQGVFAQRVPER